MWRLWPFRGRRRARRRSQSYMDDELSAFDTCLDSEAETNLDPMEHDSNLIRVEDGIGGFRHLRLPRPLDEPVLSAPSATIVSFDEKRHNRGSDERPPIVLESSKSSCKPRLGLDALLVREFGNRVDMFSLDSVSESHRKRIVSKKGVVHIGLEQNLEQRRLFLSDLFNTLLDMQWRYVLSLFCLSFFLSWLLFAVLWYLILHFRGHLDPSNEQVPCVLGISNFMSVLLFSIETQHTIGYGTRQTTEECWEGVLLQALQSVTGVMIQACVVGLIFAKVSRPKKRASTLLFSKNAVICKFDGSLCLCYRVGNIRASHLVEVHTRAILVAKKITEEGHTIPYFQRELKVGTDLAGTETQLFFIWPTTIVHRIDCSSPFYGMCAHDFVRKRYELIVSLEGIVEPTGMSIQARSSYLPNEILWGYKFANLLNFVARSGEYRVDYHAFNKIEPVELSRHSARCRRECQNHEDCDHRLHNNNNSSLCSGSVIRTPSRVSSSHNGNAVHLLIPDNKHGHKKDNNNIRRNHSFPPNNIFGQSLNKDFISSNNDHCVSVQDDEVIRDAGNEADDDQDDSKDGFE